MVIVFDLDDTLYDEIDFVKSGFKEVSEFLGSEKYFDFMWNEFIENGSGKIFNKLIEKFSLDIDIKVLIDIYRFHKPKISLPDETIDILEYAKNFKTALISDGFYITQQNKFDMLNLNKFIEYPIFTHFYHTKKPELKPFQMVMDKFKNDNYIYISDNPKKDFFAPKKLGWKTIRYKNPVGIYRDYESNAHFEVEKRSDIIKILKELNA